MIVKFILELIYNLILIVFSSVAFPGLPDVISSVLNKLIVYINSAIGIFFLFVDFDVLSVLFPIAILLIYSDNIYKATIWVLKKIPFLGMQ